MPGPICTWEGDYEVNDGTSSKMPSQVPGPMAKRSPHMWERGEAVIEAYDRARLLAPAAVVKKTGYALGEVFKGLFPGLLQTMIILGATTVLGAVVGGVIGFFFGGAGVAPGAVLGAEAGLDLGTAILTWMGVAFLAKAILQGFGELSATLSAGVKRAWAAPEFPEREYPHQIEQAANDLADCVGIFVLLILQGIVAAVLGRAGVKATGGALAAGKGALNGASDAAAGEAVAALVKQLRSSRLGSGFADWVEDNWPRLRDDPRLRFQPRELNAANAGSESTAAATQAGAAVQPQQGLAPYYPPNSGFSGVPADATLVPGIVVDRYGGLGGSYLAPEGTPFGARSLPPSAESRPLNAYEVVKPIDVKSGPAAPWFGQLGGGTQYDLGDRTVQDLIDSGHLRPIQK